MHSWLNVSQLMNLTLREDQALAVQGPQGPQGDPKFPDPNGIPGYTPPFNPDEFGYDPKFPDPDFGTPQAEPTPYGQKAEGFDWRGAANLAAIFGAGITVVGTFFSVKSQQEQLKTQALSLEHETAMSAATARRAEVEAQSIIEDMQHEIGQYTLQAGAEKGARAATMAGRGIRGGVGSAAEVQASGDYIKKVDVMSISLSGVRAAAAARAAGVNASNRALLTSVSARNVRRSAGNSLLPFGAAATSALDSANRLSPYWRRRR